MSKSRRSETQVGSGERRPLDSAVQHVGDCALRGADERDLDPAKEAEMAAFAQRQIASFEQYAKHQVFLATRGLRNPSQVEMVARAVLVDLEDEARAVGQDAPSLSEVLPPTDVLI